MAQLPVWVPADSHLRTLPLQAPPASFLPPKRGKRNPRLGMLLSRSTYNALVLLGKRFADFSKYIAMPDREQNSKTQDTAQTKGLASAESWFHCPGCVTWRISHPTSGHGFLLYKMGVSRLAPEDGSESGRFQKRVPNA